MLSLLETGLWHCAFVTPEQLLLLFCLWRRLVRELLLLRLLD